MEDTQVPVEEIAVESVPVEDVVLEPIAEPIVEAQPEAPQVAVEAPATLSQEERASLIPEGLSASPEPVTTGVCESTGEVAPLYAVRHHQPGNPHVWLYSAKAKLAHDIEVATSEKLKEVMVVNPAAVNDPVFVGQIRSQITQELMSR